VEITNRKFVRVNESLLARFRPGNCPEWVTFLKVCRGPGQYFSICVTLGQLKIYKLCVYCDELKEVLGKMNINICDKWNNSWLGTGPAVEIDPNEGFSYRKLLTYDLIIKQYGSIAGVCKESAAKLDPTS
jgi:hypothetical protein